MTLTFWSACLHISQVLGYGHILLKLFNKCVLQAKLLLVKDELVPQTVIGVTRKLIYTENFRLFGICSALPFSYPSHVPCVNASSVLLLGPVFPPHCFFKPGVPLTHDVEAHQLSWDSVLGFCLGILTP